MTLPRDCYTASTKNWEPAEPGRSRFAWCSGYILTRGEIWETILLIRTDAAFRRPTPNNDVTSTDA
jgi:hypothetical protein